MSGPATVGSDSERAADVEGTAGSEGAADVERSVDARLARLHLRGGLLALARAELERMAAAGTLDVSALADLAEVRWRNGDLMGAGQAASAHLAAGGEEPMAMIISAEALDHDGHLLDSRALAARALERVGGQVDRSFAGQPRSSVWPAAGPTPQPLAPSTMTWGGLAGERDVPDPDPDPDRSVWAAAAATSDPPALDVPDPDACVELGRAAATELAAIEEAIASQRLTGVAERLGLLLRADGALAPLILVHADRAVTTSRHDDPAAAALHLVRGDAYRELGRGSDATAAFQQSLRAVAARTAEKEHQ